MPSDTFDDAIRITNASGCGLTCMVYTQDAIKANRAVRAVDVGMFWGSNYHRSVLGTRFGSAKQSGYGREHCVETLYEVSGMGEVPVWRRVKDIFGHVGKRGPRRVVEANDVETGHEVWTGEYHTHVRATEPHSWLP